MFFWAYGVFLLGLWRNWSLVCVPEVCNSQPSHLALSLSKHMVCSVAKWFVELFNLGCLQTFHENITLCARTHTHTCAPARTHALSHAHTRTRPHTNTRTQPTHTCTYAHTYARTKCFPCWAEELRIIEIAVLPMVTRVTSLFVALNIKVYP